jgi:hypothetical protein
VGPYYSIIVAPVPYYSNVQIPYKIVGGPIAMVGDPAPVE